MVVRGLRIPVASPETTAPERPAPQKKFYHNVIAGYAVKVAGSICSNNRPGGNSLLGRVAGKHRAKYTLGADTKETPILDL